MASLIETNMLVRLADTLSLDYRIAANAIMVLHRQQEKTYITAQNLVEFRAVATRPLNVNG